MAMKDTPWAVDILAEGADILKALNVKWWLSSGTMLGIHREGKLLDHDDPDIDVGMMESNHELIKDSFLYNSYDLFAEGSHQLVFKKKEVLFDIYFYKLEGKDIVCDIYGVGRIIKPARLFEKLGRVRFRDKIYPTPNPVEDYLEVRYGDWRTPKKEKGPWTEETPALHR